MILVKPTQMREVMIPLRDHLRGIIPVVFDDEVEE